MGMSGQREALARVLANAGFIAARAEAEELLACADGDSEVVDRLLRRRLTGEPLAWITQRTSFCGLQIGIEHGVYVPRAHSEPLARRACEHLPPRGMAIDLCAGSAAIAKTLVENRPAAQVVAADVDPRAVSCARANGITAYRGDLFAALDPARAGRVDVVVCVAPYVPKSELELLQRDTFTFESPVAYDGGHDGTAILRRVVSESRHFLRPGAWLLLELGADQNELLADDLAGCGYEQVDTFVDGDGDLRGIEARLSPNASVCQQ
jgi:release factor glutamine methyltransferase